jgi:MerR family transcriptional regulator, light-induced transcriptional regulator
MAQYSIKDFENLSGIKSHTLRIWEQRYNLLSPKRTATNIRFYDDDDLKLLLNVVLLNNNGVKISKISKMTSEELKNEVIRITSSRFEYSNQIDALTLSMIELDENQFDKIISTNILHYGFEQCMVNIVYPFLTKIGVLWITGSITPAHEHFMSNLIRQKLIVAIDGQINIQGPNTKKYVLFLPESEMHELGLLFYTYVLKSRQNKVIYLGQNLPASDLSAVCEIHKPDYLLTNITSSPSGSDLQPFIDNLSKQYPALKIVLTGYQINNNKIKLPSNVIELNNVKELINFVDKN